MATTLSTSDTAPERDVFWERYKKEVMALLIIALVAVAGYGGYRLYSDQQANAASAMLASAKTAADFQKVISNYPSAPAGGSAYLLLADAQRNEKKFSEANATLQIFLDKFPKHELAGTARLAIQRLPSTLERSARDRRFCSSRPAVQPPPIIKAPEPICFSVRWRWA